MNISFTESTKKGGQTLVLTIKDNNIHLTRGDDAEFELKLMTPDGKPYELQEGQKAVFTMRKGPRHNESKPPLVQKEFSDNVVSLKSADTKYLEYGAYLWDVQVSNAEEQVNTVALGHFILTAEVG